MRVLQKKASFSYFMRASRTCLPTLAFAALFSLAAAAAADAFDLFPDVGKSIGKSVQDVGKAIEKGVRDTGTTTEKGAHEVEQSPSDPCKINGKLPQCDLDKVEK